MKGNISIEMNSSVKNSANLSFSASGYMSPLLKFPIIIEKKWTLETGYWFGQTYIQTSCIGYIYLGIVRKYLDHWLMKILIESLQNFGMAILLPDRNLH